MGAVFISSVMALVTCGWLALTGAALVWATRRVAAYERDRPGSAGMFNLVPFGYFLSLQSALLSLVIGALMVRTPGLARQGRVSILWAVIFGVLQIMMLWVAALHLLRR